MYKARVTVKEAWVKAKIVCRKKWVQMVSSQKLTYHQSQMNEHLVSKEGKLRRKCTYSSIFDILNFFKVLEICTVTVIKF